jgi:serine/threonine-protein kinase
MPTIEARLSELLERWDEHRRQGQTVSPADLCRDCPELLQDLRLRIRDLEEMDAALATGLETSGEQRPARDEVTSGGPSVAGYEVRGELGRGGMGVVYLARQVGLNRPCALKMILAGAHAGGEAVRRFQAEAEAIARLKHPNIVQIYASGEHDGRPFFEMEYVEGGSLDRALDGTPRLPREAARLIETVARAVGEAHRLGIVHRDLKPGNILVAADGAPKVADFGLAKALGADSDLTRSDSVLGTPSYMAPEQAGGHAKEAGPAVDVYALGAILYELLVGRPPFRGASVLETLEQVKTAEPVPPSRLVPGLPRDLETIALKCLQKEPARRYESAAALAEDLRRFAAGEPTRARPIGAAERAWRWARRHPGVAVLSTTLVVTLAMGLAVMTLLWARSEGLRLDADQQRQAADRLRVQADHRREQAEENLAEADRQRTRAEANLAAARAAVDDYLTKVASDRLLAAPGLQTLRRDLLRSALGFYREFLSQHKDDPALRAGLAEVHLRVGRIYRELGVDEAVASFRAARDLYHALAAARSDDREARLGLADCQLALGQPAEAVALLDALHRAVPGDDRARRRLADAYHALASEVAAAGRMADALEAHRKALPLREASARARPDEPEARLQLAATLNSLGALLSQRDHDADALGMYFRALEHEEAAAAQAYRGGLAGTIAGDHARQRGAEAAPAQPARGGPALGARGRRALGAAGPREPVGARVRRLPLPCRDGTGVIATRAGPGSRGVGGAAPGH